MRDTPDDMTATVACPTCESENVETLPADGIIARRYTYTDRDEV